MEGHLKQRALPDPAAEARPVGEGRRRSGPKGTRAHLDDLGSSAKDVPAGGLSGFGSIAPGFEVRGGGGGGAGGGGGGPGAGPFVLSASALGSAEPRAAPGFPTSPPAGAGPSSHGWPMAGGWDHKVPAGGASGPGQRPVKSLLAQGKGEGAVAMAVDPLAPLPPQAVATSAAAHKAGRGAYTPMGAAAGGMATTRRPQEARRHPDAVAGTHRHPEEVRAVSTKKAALQRAIHAGATGHYKACDSLFGNPLVPAIPLHYLTGQAHRPLLGSSSS